MVEIKVYYDIDSREACMSLTGRREVFSAEMVKDIFNDYPNETDFRFNINCNGGSVAEGFTIYDIIRTSGKNIYCNIDGACHSMAIVLLLAAPYENRTANPNATTLIHDVRTDAYEITAGTATQLAAELTTERNRILAIYAQRTKLTPARLEAIMMEEKMHTAKELLEWGFISRINNYNTNKLKSMTKKKRTVHDFMDYLGKYFKSADVKNHAFTDAGGDTLFVTDREDESLEMGDNASPDGVFELPDGRIVTIESGVVTSIEEMETPEELSAQIGLLKAQLNKSNALLAEAREHLRNLAETRSRTNIGQRQGIIGKGEQKTSAELKNEVRKNLGKTLKKS